MSLQPETLEMIAIFDWVRLKKYDHFIFHIANERKATPMMGKTLKRMGVRSGVSDIFVARGRGRYGGAFIELKSKNKYGKFGQPTENQLKFLEDMRFGNYYAEVAYGLDDAIVKIAEYLEIA